MNKHEINAYKQALEKYNPFHGGQLPDYFGSTLRDY